MIDYTKRYEFEYQGKIYIFNPYAFGIGNWQEKTPLGKAGKYADKETQKKLNKAVFGKENLPNLLERYKNMTLMQQSQQQKISLEWLKLKVKGLQQNATTIPGSIDKNSDSKQIIGKMYFYLYDAKWKDKLPYWDKFPLTIILNSGSDRMLGLNLHYLNRGMRAALLSKFLSTVIYDDKNDTFKFTLSYLQLVNFASKYVGYKPCLKQYLISNINSKMLEINMHEWAYAVYLPVEQFQKKRNSYVWEDSQRKIKGN